MDKVVQSMKWREAERSEGVVVEKVEAGSDFALREPKKLANTIYSTSEVPENMNEAMGCGNHKTISMLKQSGTNSTKSSR